MYTPAKRAKRAWSTTSENKQRSVHRKVHLRCPETRPCISLGYLLVHRCKSLACMWNPVALKDTGAPIKRRGVRCAVSISSLQQQVGRASLSASKPGPQKSHKSRKRATRATRAGRVSCHMRPSCVMATWQQSSAAPALAHLVRIGTPSV